MDTPTLLARIDSTLALFGQDKHPAGHGRHVRWLMHQYAMDRPTAEAEAQKRYRRFPHELARWDRSS